MNPLVDIWRQIFAGAAKSWVLFRNGTCVVLREAQADARAQAIELMKEWGPVHPGTDAGDFSVLDLPNVPGWVVTGHHEDILTYIAPQEVGSGRVDEVLVGLIGRAKRDQDAEELGVIHIEDMKQRRV